MSHQPLAHALLAALPFVSNTASCRIKKHDTFFLPVVQVSVRHLHHSQAGSKIELFIEHAKLLTSSNSVAFTFGVGRENSSEIIFKNACAGLALRASSSPGPIIISRACCSLLIRAPRSNKKQEKPQRPWLLVQHSAC